MFKKAVQSEAKKPIKDGMSKKKKAKSTPKGGYGKKGY